MAGEFRAQTSKNRLSKKFSNRIGSTTRACSKSSGFRVILAISILSLLMFSFSFVSMAKASQTMVTTIPVGAGPFAVAYDSGMGEVFVANEFSSSVSVISDVSNTVVATVNLGGFWPLAEAYDSGMGEVFVADSAGHFAGDSVKVISDVSNTVVATIPVGTFPVAVAYDGGTREVFVTNSQDDTVSVISDVSNTVAAIVKVGAHPLAVAYDSGVREIFVTDLDSTVRVISDATVSPDFAVSASPSILSITRGTSTNVTVTLTSMNHFSGIVSLTSTIAPMTPKSPSLTLSATSLTITSGETATSMLKISTAHSPQGDGAYVITVTATSGSVMHTITINLSVTKT